MLYLTCCSLSCSDEQILEGSSNKVAYLAMSNLIIRFLILNMF
ncbi:hypothetical protein PPRY_a2793 [Pseudoalteromonas prydzensis ACAM 620]|nr:hypothetical protein [Pseudoalteromonas prydzensis ACAM 620]